MGAAFFSVRLSSLRYPYTSDTAYSSRIPSALPTQWPRSLSSTTPCTVTSRPWPTPRRRAPSRPATVRGSRLLWSWRLPRLRERSLLRLSRSTLVDSMVGARLRRRRTRQDRPGQKRLVQRPTLGLLRRNREGQRRGLAGCLLSALSSEK